MFVKYTYYNVNDHNNIVINNINTDLVYEITACNCNNFSNANIK